MTIILDHITTINYASGGNLKGQGVSANWIFLLPQLDLKRIVCIGAPPEDILTTLKLFSDELICSGFVDNKDVAIQSLEQIPSSSVDLIYVCDTHSVMFPELKRILQPDGLLYYEYYGQDHTDFAMHARTTGRFWLTPTLGKMQTAVRVDQIHGTAFMRYRQLYTSTIRHQTFERLGKSLVGKPSLLAVTQKKGEAVTASPSTVQNVTHPLKRPLYAALRYSQGILISSASWVEQRLIHNSFTSRWTRRYGTLMQNEKGISEGPPRYLQIEAEKNGVDISNWEWIFVAKGDFPSQKLLFYLFPENMQTPSVIVKMVRDPEYNERLEREYRGLSYLGALNFGHRHSIPQVKFHGYHHGLYFVAESVLDGRPFTSKSTFDSQCTHAQFVVQWLIDLGAATRTDGNGAEIATLMMPLYERFVEIYKPDELLQRFVKQHLDYLGRAGNIPLVSRHGDPGLQNLLVTSDNSVAFLDWENAELKSLPLWDVFYFFSAYSIKAGQVKKKLSTLDAYEHYFLNKSPIQPLFINAVNRYCDALSMDRGLIVPLYYIFWMYRALKQSTMVNPKQMQNASTWQLLQLSITRQDSSTFHALV